MDKHRLMMRMWMVLGNIEELLHENKPKTAHLAAVQWLKSIHQFVLDNNWRVARKLNNLPDPLYRARVGATEVEIETIVGELRVENDIPRRSKQAGTGKDETDDA